MPTLTLYNTLTGKKEPLTPLVPGQVQMYVCGVTVYDDCHVGHGRSAVVFDVIRRHLEYRGLAVTFVKNFTDVDDKIIQRSQELGIPWQAVTSRYIDAYQRDMRRLEVRPATVEPKATEHMADIIGLIRRLLDKGMAYQVEQDVYFHVEKFPHYGRLSKRKLEDLQAGARVEVDPRKRHPMDFALWKGAKPGEPAWDSPWGPGRPGWHIECSAMSIRHLGETFDIHGGGLDLIFPHHENEIAQSTAATGTEFARVWIHNGLVTVNQEKMSKSLGNFITIQDIFEKFPASEPVAGEVVRFFLLSAHYRSPLDFSEKALREARAALNNCYDLFQRLEEKSRAGGAADADVRLLLHEGLLAFEHAMDDDCNTPAALGALQVVRSGLNSLLGQGLSMAAAREALAMFRRCGQVLGLLQVPVREWEFGETGTRAAPQLDDAAVERYLALRREARAKKDWAHADAIRRELAAQGITIEDRPDGTTRWKR